MDTAQSNQHKLLTIRQASDRLGVSPTTLRRWDIAGILSPIRTNGNQRRYTLEQLDHFVIGAQHDTDNYNYIQTDFKTIEPEEYKPLVAQFGILEHNADTGLDDKLVEIKQYFPNDFTHYKYSLQDNDPPPKNPKKLTDFFYIGTVMVLITLILGTGYFFFQIPKIKHTTSIATSSIVEGVNALSGSPKVLASRDDRNFVTMVVSVPSIFSDDARFGKDIEIANNATVSGILTAPNIVYSVNPGTNITIAGDPQNPTISVANLVTTFQGSSGAITLTGGTDISISSTTISNTSTLATVRSRGGCDRCVTASDVATNLTITSDGSVAVGALDGVVSVGNGGTGLSSFATGDILYASATNTLSALGIGSAGYVLTVSGGIPSWQPAGSGTNNYWDSNAGALFPFATTNDVLVGASATASALVKLPGTSGGDTFFNTGGNIAIGTTDASNFVNLLRNVDGAARIQATNANGGSSAYLQIQLSNGTNGLDITKLGNSYSSVTGAHRQDGSFIGDSGTGGLSLAASNASGQIRFYTTGTDDASERMQISSTGNVGIGSTSPGAKLDITGTLRVSGTTTFNSLTYTWPASQSNGYVLQTNGSGTLSWTDPTTLPDAYWQRNLGALSPKNITDDILLGASSTTSALIKLSGTSGGSYLNGGNVGIGTTTTNNGTLQVYQGASNVNILTLSDSGQADRYQFKSDDGSQTKFIINAGTSVIEGQDTMHLALANGSGNLITMTQTGGLGRVGIGSTSPIGKFNVNGAATGKALAILNETGDQAVFTASVAGSTKFLIANDGNIGIGTTNTSTTAFEYSNSLPLINFDRTANYNWYLGMYDGATNLGNGAGNAGGLSDFILYDASSTPEATRFLVEAVSGNVGIGTINPVGQFHLTRPISWGATGKALATFNQIEPQDIFTASASGTTRFVINNSGNVGIGTALPVNTLAVIGTGYFSGNVGIGTTNPTSALVVRPSATSGTYLSISPNNVTSTSSITGISQNFTTLNSGTYNSITGMFVQLQSLSSNTATVTNKGINIDNFGGSNSGTNTYSITPYDMTQQTLIQNTAAGTITFKGINIAMPHTTQTTGTINAYGVYVDGGTVTSGNAYAFVSEASAGNVGIGTTAPAQLFHAYRSSDGVVARFEDSSGTCDINPTTTTLSCSSDVNLKKDISSLNNATSLDKILNLRTVSYKWKNQLSDDMRYGFIAQEVEAVMPELVTTNANGLKAISVNGFTPFLVGAIQDQQLAINNLKSQLNSVVLGASSQTINSNDSKLTNLESRILELETFVSSSSGNLAQSIDTTYANLDLTETHATISGTLNVLGRSTLSDVGITGDLNIGILSVHGLEGEINTLADDLKLQSLALGGVDIMNGKVRIEKDGTVTIEGTLEAKTVETERIKVAKPQNENDATIGKGTIPAEQKSVTIISTQAKNASKIFVTPRTKTGGQPLLVTGIKNGESFTVELEESHTENIDFDWWIIN